MVLGGPVPVGLVESGLLALLVGAVADSWALGLLLALSPLVSLPLVVQRFLFLVEIESHG